MKLYTIGFTKKNAQQFFSILKEHHIDVVIDVRLNPAGQLAGFAKGKDLAFFLQRLNNCDYIQCSEYAPTKEIRDKYNKDKNWSDYAKSFKSLIRTRNKLEAEKPGFLKRTACLLCSEEQADKCHRRLVAEYLNGVWGDIEIHHL